MIYPMTHLEVKRTANGRTLARRRDGRPLTSDDRKEAKQMIQIQVDLTPIRAWIVQEARGENGVLRAVLICSAVLQDHLWLILDRDFISHDGLACYYAEEIALLKGKSLEDLREIHKYKLAFPGARVLQDGAHEHVSLP